MLAHQDQLVRLDLIAHAKDVEIRFAGYVVAGHPCARAAAERALENDEELAEVHASQGTTLADYYWTGTAPRRVSNGLSLSRLITRLHASGILFERLGRFQEMLAEAEKAVALDMRTASRATMSGRGRCLLN